MTYLGHFSLLGHTVDYVYILHIDKELYSKDPGQYYYDDVFVIWPYSLGAETSAVLFISGENLPENCDVMVCGR